MARLKEIKKIKKRGAESMSFLSCGFVKNAGHGHSNEYCNFLNMRRFKIINK